LLQLKDSVYGASGRIISFQTRERDSGFRGHQISVHFGSLRCTGFRNFPGTLPRWSKRHTTAPGSGRWVGGLYEKSRAKS